MIIISPKPMSRASDTFIEKDSSINEQIDRMRHAATRALFERKDVHHRCLGVLHLRYRLERRLYGDGFWDPEKGETYGS